MIQSYKTTLGAVGSTFTGQLSPGMDFLEVVDAQGTLFFDFADGGRVEASKSDVLYFSPAAPLPQGFSVSSDTANNTIHLRAGRGRSMRLANAGGGTGTVTIGGPLPLPVTAEQFGVTKATTAFAAFPSGMLRGTGGGNAELLPLRAHQDGQALIAAGDVRTDVFNLTPGANKQAWLYGAGLVAVRITQLPTGDSCQVQIADSIGNWHDAPIYNLQGYLRNEIGKIIFPGLYIVPTPAAQQIRIVANAGNAQNVQGVIDLSRTRESWRPLPNGPIVTQYDTFTGAGTFTLIPINGLKIFRIVGYKWRAQGGTATVTFKVAGVDVYPTRSSANDDSNNATIEGDFLFTAVGGNVSATLSGSFTSLQIALRYAELWGI
jgi:hypothetical protein